MFFARICSVCLRLFIFRRQRPGPLERYRAAKNWNSADHSVFVKRFRAERRSVKQALLSMPCYLPFFDSKGHAPSLVHILQITNYRDMQLTSVSIYQYRSSYNIKHRPVGNFTKNESFRAYYRSSPRESSLKRITRIVPQNLQKAKQLTATTSTSKTAMSQTVVDNRMWYAI